MFIFFSSKVKDYYSQHGTKMPANILYEECLRVLVRQNNGVALCPMHQPTTTGKLKGINPRKNVENAHANETEDAQRCPQAGQRGKDDAKRHGTVDGVNNVI